MQDVMTTWRLKMVAAAAIDVADCVFRVPGVGSGAELVFTALGVMLWGKEGYWMLTELMDVTEQVDGFVPMCCIIGWKCKPSVAAGAGPATPALAA